MVIHESEICIEFELSVLMIAGSYYGFLLDAGHAWRSCLTRPHLELYKREAMWGQDGFVSIYLPEGYRYGYCFGTGETLERKEQYHNQRTNVFQDIARYPFG